MSYEIHYHDEKGWHFLEVESWEAVQQFKRDNNDVFVLSIKVVLHRKGELK